MTSLIKSAKVTNCWLKNNVILVTSVRNHWNKDYKPGPYPLTATERAAAAEKYGLPLSEYRPYRMMDRLHAEYDLLREDRYNVNAKFRKPMWYMWAQFLGTMFGTFGIYLLFEKIRMFPAVLPKQYPNQGKEHYTFESN
ncbi:hypothetical protein NQ318_015461 [Aromia moschata]|uniref:NADH dehydrogenase [ubiquinone] 1 beta subcomplex subunit 8, mitochondrial n=1 Tax=Aromia moschata TaxID=1265417 RepID=A0AAV8XGR5_9CUCU|nr:hypothetical protein NQ318_015461 [Aromia moschata]